MNVWTDDLIDSPHPILSLPHTSLLLPSHILFLFFMKLSFFLSITTTLGFLSLGSGASKDHARNHIAARHARKSLAERQGARWEIRKMRRNGLMKMSQRTRLLNKIHSLAFSTGLSVLPIKLVGLLKLNGLHSTLPSMESWSRSSHGLTHVSLNQTPISQRNVLPLRKVSREKQDSTKKLILCLFSCDDDDSYRTQSIFHLLLCSVYLDGVSRANAVGTAQSDNWAYCYSNEGDVSVTDDYGDSLCIDLLSYRLFLAPTFLSFSNPF